MTSADLTQPTIKRSKYSSVDLTQPTITRSKLTIETLEQDAKKKKKCLKLTMKTPERRRWRDMLHQSVCRSKI